MKHALVHRFQAALVGAQWGYAQGTPQTPSPFACWAELVSPAPETSDLYQSLWQRSGGSPLTLWVAALPLLLAYSDDEGALRRWLAPLRISAIAVEGACALRQWVDDTLCEQPVMLPAGADYPQLFPYLEVTSAYFTSGAGMVQVRAALEQVARDRVGAEFTAKFTAGSDAGSAADPASDQGAIALALALWAASKTPGQVELACRRTAATLAPAAIASQVISAPAAPALIIPALAAPAAAIAGYLCGLQQGISSLSTARYQMLDVPLPVSSDRPAAAITVNQLSRALLAAWGGAAQPLGPAAIAMPNVIRAGGR